MAPSLIQILVALAFLSVIGYQFVVDEPKAALIQQQLEAEFRLVPAFPGATPSSYSASHKPTNVLVGENYVVQPDYRQLRAFYDHELSARGWQFCGEKKAWFREEDLGRMIAAYRKGDLRATLQYAGELSDFEWDAARAAAVPTPDARVYGAVGRPWENGRSPSAGAPSGLTAGHRVRYHLHGRRGSTAAPPDRPPPPFSAPGAHVPEHLGAPTTQPAAAYRRPLARAMLISIRPKQWTKNGLLFLGLIFSMNLGQPDLGLRVVVAFLDFCLLASATYLLNDVADLERDRQHPLKRKRPIAAGDLAPALAVAAAATMLVVSLLVAAGLGAPFALAVLLYLVQSISYSMWLKHVVILDVLAVAAGFVIRAAAGALVIGVPISPWLYVCTMLGALFIAFSKRRHELVLLEKSAANHRRILEEYSIPLLDQMISVVASATVIAYSLYTFTSEYLPKNSAMMLTIPFLLYGIFRYLYLIHVKGVGGAPEDVLLADRPLQLTILGWGLASTAILYLARY